MLLTVRQHMARLSFSPFLSQPILHSPRCFVGVSKVPRDSVIAGLLRASERQFLGAKSLGNILQHLKAEGWNMLERGNYHHFGVPKVSIHAMGIDGFFLVKTKTPEWPSAHPHSRILYRYVSTVQTHISHNLSSYGIVQALCKHDVCMCSTCTAPDAGRPRWLCMVVLQRDMVVKNHPDPQFKNP